jgi:hypothetical protein
MKPTHAGGYTPHHALLCERTLVTLMRGLGPWTQCVYLAGGLVPRYLIPEATRGEAEVHVGTTDVDLVLSLEVMADLAAYRRLEQNLKHLGFERGRNEADRLQHFSWWKRVQDRIVVVDLLCDGGDERPAGRAVPLPGERRLSALQIPGAHLVERDHVVIPVTADMLDDLGYATVEVRVAGIVAFLVLKALAYEERFEAKDAYDIVYCLLQYPAGPAGVASAFAGYLARFPDDAFVHRALAIFRARFLPEGAIAATAKDGPRSYARFLADPGRPQKAALDKRQAARAVEELLADLDALRPER